MGRNKTKFGFVLVNKNNKVFKRYESHSLRVATSASGERHGQKKVVKNKQTVRKRISKLKKNNREARFQERIKELVEVYVPDW